MDEAALPGDGRMGWDRATAFGAAAALLWALFSIRWFDVGAPRPAALAAVPPLAVGLPLAAALLLWLGRRWRLLWGAPLGAARGSLLLLLGLAFCFRLPTVVGGAGATVTSDGALSGIVALHVRDGIERLVFVPHVPYSGSLKSHLTAPLAAVIDPARAFALASVLFYLAHVAGLFRLALLVAGPRLATLAGLFAAFSPAFVTRYSLSNDGNYVELLAFGSWALYLALRWMEERAARPRLAFAIGLLLGLGFWCHILAVIHLAALASLLLVVGRLAALRSLAALASGWALGYAPGWIWNVANGWQSFEYLLPGVARTDEHAVGIGAVTTGLGGKLWRMVVEHGPVLMGYDPGHAAPIDHALLAVAWLGVAAAVSASCWTAWRAYRTRSAGLAALPFFALANLAVALVALPHVPGNPRYILFEMSVLPVMLAVAFGHGLRRLLLLLLIAVNALASFSDVPPTIAADARWRQFVAALEREGVRYCYTDFFLATRLNFLSGEKLVCSAKLGPFTTEYFFRYREEVEGASEAALIPVNRTAAGRIERRLSELGVGYERRELLKPVLLRLSRKVDPEELFPGRDLSPR